MSGTLPWLQVLAVSLGAAAGALLRWLAGLWLNPGAGVVPLGTLLVNCAGGLLVGAGLVWFQRCPNELLRLLLITGFLGGLTTFSTFSGESLLLMQRGAWGGVLLHTLVHVLGSLACAAVGFRLMRAVLG